MKIKLLVMDVDGTLTDGCIYVGPEGEAMKAFDVKDGYAIANLLPDIGVVPVIITGRKSSIVEHRARELKITELHQGVSDKLAELKAVAEKYGASADEVACIGDDLNDLECMRWCSLSAAPADAVKAVYDLAAFKCTHNGGRGAVREFCEYVLSVNEKVSL